MCKFDSRILQMMAEKSFGFSDEYVQYLGECLFTLYTITNHYYRPTTITFFSSSSY